MRVSRNFMSAMLGIGNKSTTKKSRMMDRLSTNSASRLFGTQSSNKTNSTQTNYQNMKNNAGELQSIVSKLTDEKEDSLFAKAQESGDTSAIKNQVKEFVSKYNGMVKSLRNSGSRVDNSYLNQLNSYATMYRSSLQATGVTKNADGTLSVDDKTLSQASVEQLKKAWGTDSSFAKRAGAAAVNVQENAVSGMNTLIGNAYSNLLQNYGSRGNYFNFWS
ncbi:MAG: hypothetical protein NC231_12635 [Bacillus sp. (in: Bacteria)]|nr:hypothetical protein [Bacillus sp. (in: firmicutes)]MCM1427897.1 hypothetical protein [Eubacterium sp.]